MKDTIFAIQLKTEHANNPIGIGKKPRFSWKIQSVLRNQRQSAYRLIVADEIGAVVWDSGKVYSQQIAGIEYGGLPLDNCKKYTWKVRVWDGANVESAFSDWASFETGIEEKDWKAEWIGAATKNAPYFRKSFVLATKTVRKARLYVTGLGNHETYLNGQKVSDNVLEPLVTQYHKRVFYSTYDVTALLQERKNAIGVMLGRGYYATLPNGKDWQVCNWAKGLWYDERKLRLKLLVEYADGATEEIVTDKSWKTSESPLVFDEPYYGEAYDARLEKEGWNLPDYDDSDWNFAIRMQAPFGEIVPFYGIENRIVETAEPIFKMTLNKASLNEDSLNNASLNNAVKNNVTLFDFGKILSGWCEIVIKGPRSAKVKIQYCERIQKEGGIDRRGLLTDSIFDGELREGQTDYYTLKGDGEEYWQPLFTYKGFRYVEITADNGVEILALRGKFVHADVESIGEFSCSDARLNRIHEMCRRSLLVNFHSYPSDTPVYENMGYLADGHVTQDTAAYNFDVLRFYEKWAEDIRLQVKLNGYLEQTAPMWDEDKENAPEWSLAIVLVPWQQYLFYGDKKILRDNYAEMQKVFDYQMRLGENLLFQSMWGDHGGGLRRISPTAYMYYSATILSEIAKVLGDEKAGEYMQIAEQIKQAFHLAFFDKKEGYYREKGDGFHLNAQILPLAFGIAPEDIKTKLFGIIQEKTVDLQCLDAGIFSVKYLFSLFTENGLGERALEMILKEQYHSYGYLLGKGATTLWESWEEDTRSCSHHMYGSVDEYFYRTLGGIQREGVGFSSFILKPYLPKNLDWCKAATDTLYGRIESHWGKKDKGFVWDITVPMNTTATVYIPANEGMCVFENGNPIEQVPEIVFLRREDEYCVYALGGGRYAFTCQKD